MKSKIYTCILVCLIGLIFQNASAQCNGIRYKSYVFSTYKITTVTYSSPYNLQMDIYQPAGDTLTARPLVVLAHGGTFISGSRTDDGTVVSLCQNLAKRGYVTCSIDYRLGDPLQFLDSTYVINEVIESISDAKAAVRFFYEDAYTSNVYKIDTNKIFIGGNSAGAVMAMHYAYLDNLNEVPAYLQNIINQNGGINGNSGNPGYSSKVAGVVNLAGGLNIPQLITPGNLPVVSAQGDQDVTVPYYCNDPEFIDIIQIPVRLCGLGSLEPLIAANIPYNANIVFPGDAHVPWNSDTSKFNRVDTLVTGFLYKLTGVQENGNLAAFCQGGTARLAAGTGSKYLWSTGQTAGVILVTAPGTYTVTVTGSNGCTAAAGPVVLNFNPVPPATISASGPTNLCQGQGSSVTLTTESGSAYKWSSGQTTQAITVSTAGYYSVTATNSFGCTATSAPTVVNLNPPPSVSIAALGNTTFCQGGDVPLFAQGQANTYQWSNGATSASILAATAGNYIVTITDFNGCSAASSPVAVTVLPLPGAGITAGGPTTFCQGGSVALTASAAVSYAWSNGATSAAISASAAGPYNVTVTGSKGCSAASDTTNITVEALPKASISANGPTTFCTGGAVTLTANSGSSYKWSNGLTTRAITVSAAGSYIVTLTNAQGCSKASAAKKVVVNALPLVTITTRGTVCNGATETITAKKIAKDVYAWSTGADTNFIKVTSPGTYFVTVTSAQKCSAQDSVLISPCLTLEGLAAKTDGSAANVSTSSNDNADFIANVYPNPYTGQFHLKIQSSSASNINVRIFDVNGKLLEERNNVPSNNEILLGNGYANGIYFVQLRQEQCNRQLRVVKID